MGKQIRVLGKNIGNEELVVMADLNAKCFINFCWQILSPAIWLSGSAVYQLWDLPSLKFLIC